MILNKILKTSVSLRMIAVMLLLAVAGQSCRISYKLNGSAIDYTVYKTIYIGQFPIRAALVYAPLQQTFELNLQDYITRNTRLQMTDSPGADLNLEGEITGYALSPQAVTQDAYASQTRLTITVRVKLSRHIVILTVLKCLTTSKKSFVLKSVRSLLNSYLTLHLATGNN